MYSVLSSVKLKFKLFHKLRVFFVFIAFLESVPTFIEMGFVNAINGGDSDNDAVIA